VDPNEVEIRKHREQFIKAFQDIAVATANLAAISKKQIELMNQQIDVVSGQIESIMLPKDGLRDVLDELIDEIRGLREDLRVVAKAGGLQTTLAALFGAGRKRS